MTNLLKIENFINEKSYSELIEFSANFNTRLSIERKLRMPFLDPQTGVAQKHSNLYFKKSQRLPGYRNGQLYTYPSTRWRSSKRSFKYSSQPFYRLKAADNFSSFLNSTTNHHLSASSSSTATTNVPVQPPVAAVIAENGDTNGGSDFQAHIEESNSMAGDTDSKDSQNIKEDSIMSSKDWYYDDMMDPNDIGSEEQGDSDFEFSLNGYKRKKKAPTSRKSTAGRKPKDSTDGATKKSRSSANSSGGGGGSSRNSNSNRSRKSSSRSKSKNDKIVEPPSFDSMSDFNQDGSTDGFGAYRNF